MNKRQSEDADNRYRSLLQDFERAKDDLKNQLLKNDEMKRELWFNVDERKKVESDLRALEQEVVIYRGNLSELESANIKDMNSMRQQITDMRYQHEEAIRQINLKSDEIVALNKDIISWREVVERMNNENKELKFVIEDLETKNRKLVEKINE